MGEGCRQDLEKPVHDHGSRAEDVEACGGDRVAAELTGYAGERDTTKGSKRAILAVVALVVAQLRVPGRKELRHGLPGADSRRGVVGLVSWGCRVGDGGGCDGKIRGERILGLGIIR